MSAKSAVWVLLFNGNGELANAIAIGIGVGVLPEIILQFSIVGMRLGETIAFHVDGQRIVPQVAELSAQIITHDSVDHERSVHFPRSREDFSARQVSPFLPRNDSAGLQPVIIMIQLRRQIGGAPPGRQASRGIVAVTSGAARRSHRA